MKKSVSLVFIFFGVLVNANRKYAPGDVDHKVDPDTFLNVSQLISSKGYPVEDHTVTTIDGFILSLQHIVHGKKQDDGHAKNPRKVVFLQHGLLSSAADFVLNFPDQSLGFVLADSGYDVWLGNTRGNTYSRHHVNYTPQMREFWNFSFDQMAEYDLPAMIDYVLNVTGQEKLYYIGHSQGTTSAFALLSENPVYNKKIKLFIALAPVAMVGHITSAIKYLVPFTNDIHFLLEILGINDFLPHNAIINILSEYVCSEPIDRFLCEDVLFLLCGYDLAQLNQTRLGVYLSQVVAGSSSKSIVHYAQLVKSKLFTKYDYGMKLNLVHYKQTTPPEYNVSRITAPTALVWGVNDLLADPIDVEFLQEKLKSLISSYPVPYPFFGHQDFILAVDAHKLYFGHVLDLLAHH